MIFIIKTKIKPYNFSFVFQFNNKTRQASCGFSKKMKHSETFHLLATHFATNGLDAPACYETWIAKEGFLFVHMEFSPKDYS